MVIELGNIATIQIGMVLQKADQAEQVVLLQTADFDETGRMMADAPRTWLSRNQGIPDRAWVCPGDVLLIGKGPRNTAIYYQEHYPSAVASATFYILRVIGPDTILPEFLACYINQPSTQAQLRSRISSATTVPTLNKKDLLDLPIPLLPLSVQQRLVDLHNGFITVRDLDRQLINHHQNLVIQCFSTIISEQT